MSKKIHKSELGVMPWRDFVLGFQVASQSLEEAPAEQNTDSSTWRSRRGKSARGDDPKLRVMLAVREHFGTDYPHLACFVFRFWALIDLLRRGHISQWVTGNEAGSQTFHPAVLLAAAETRLTNNGKFPPNRFSRLVEQIIEEESAEPIPEDTANDA